LVTAEHQSAIAHNNLGHALQRQGRLSEPLASYKAALAIQPDFAEAWQNYLFGLSYASGYSVQEIFEEHVKFGRQLEGSVAGLKPEHRNARDPGNSSDSCFTDFRFTRRVFIEPVLASRSRSRVYCYYNGWSDAAD
jgi:tetratricopeptide (TPR) repeat protein